MPLSSHLHPALRVAARRGARKPCRAARSTRVALGRPVAPVLSRPNSTLHASLPAACTVAALSAHPPCQGSRRSFPGERHSTRPKWWLKDHPSRHDSPSKGSARFNRAFGRPSAWCSDGVRIGPRLVSRLRSSMRAFDGHRDNGLGSFSRDTCSLRGSVAVLPKRASGASSGL